ncbi:hypothetical protein [Methanobrevibacter sp.]|uniref:DNA replication complex subunit Gins51 n=1 Tax=Methanobrevibacter sp. TaxID=66852 RepID=UPI0038669D7C
MDQFYKELRTIQKKERNNATLARVEENFYSKIHEYLDDLKQQAIRDPFSNIPQILHEAQRIATEICERREHKITDAAVVNIHRSYHLFTGKPQFDLVDTTPLNLTPEEEKFYFSLIDTLKNHRGNISLEKLSDGDEIPDKKVIKPKETQSNTLISPKPTENDDKIFKANPVEDKKTETIEKQISDSQNNPPKEDIEVKPKNENIEDNPNAFDETEEFYDLESRKIAKDTELVTMLVFDEVDPIVGVDERIYGPFRPQDLVTLPLINAKVFFKNRKGRQVKI